MESSEQLSRITNDKDWWGGQELKGKLLGAKCRAVSLEAIPCKTHKMDITAPLFVR